MKISLSCTIDGMKVPLSWLKKYIHLPETVETLSKALTELGLEVDGISGAQFPFEGVIVGEVLSYEKHPQADQLGIAQVSDGKETSQVVCGAPNCRQGLKVAYAPPGAALNTQEKPFVLSRKTLRGVESAGMLCAEDELGMGTDHKGILELPDSAPVGADFATYIADPIFHLALTPNLGYCRSVLGIARELGAYFSRDVVLPTITSPKVEAPLQKTPSITNTASEGCLQYNCALLTQIQVKPSPQWLRQWVEQAGYQSINNIVDITNFVMHEWGVPMHAFDFQKLEGECIDIRKSTLNETITTLDGQRRQLPQNTLLICDAKHPVAIAGIMGSEASAVQNTTTSLLLEAAQFDPSAIRKASKALSLRTEASARFENGIDPQAVSSALQRAIELLQQEAGAKLASEILQAHTTPYTPRTLSCRTARVNHILGTSFLTEQIQHFLERVGCKIIKNTSDTLCVEIPSWRNDITSEIDLIEEVARIFGVNNIERRPPRHITTPHPHHPLYLLEKRLRQALTRQGLREFITCNLISPELCDIEMDMGLFRPEYIQVLHAKSVDQSILRPSLLPGMLNSVCANQRQKQLSIRAFELGRVHFREGTQFTEKSALGLLLSGTREVPYWDRKEMPVDFYDMKGLLEDLAKALRLPPLTFSKSDYQTFHPHKQVTVHYVGDPETHFGVLGQLHPATLAKLDIQGEVYFAELDLLGLAEHLPQEVQFQSLARYPSSERDHTFSIPNAQPLTELFDTLQDLRKQEPLLETVQLLDIYPKTEGKQVTFRFTYRDRAKTLKVSAVEKTHANILTALTSALTA